MKTAINIILLIILITVWSVFYQKNIKNKDISKTKKILIIVFILLFNGFSLYLLNISFSKLYIAEFGKIEIKISLNNLEKYLKKENSDYKNNLKKDAIKITSDILTKHSFKFNPASKNEVKISLTDTVTYQRDKKVYLLKMFLKYPYKNGIRENTIYLEIKENNFNYKKLLSLYQNTLNEALNSIFYGIKLSYKKTSDLIDILEHKYNLPDIYYVQVFNALLLKDNPPKLKTKTLIRFLKNPTTFSEATGYAIVTDNCDAISFIIDRSLYFDYELLNSLLSILTQSKCRVVEGYLRVLKSSQRAYISNMASKYLKLYFENQKKEFTYEKGKKTKEE